MRILLAQNSLYYPAHGGGDKSNRLLLEALAGRGHQCRVVARVHTRFGEREHQQYLRELEARAVTGVSADDGVVRFPLNGVEVHAVTSHPNFRAYFAAQIAQYRPAVIILSTDDPAQLLLEAALRVNNARIVYLTRTTLALPFGPESAFPSEEKTEALRATDGVVGVSRYVADYIRKWSGIQAEALPISLLGPGPYPDLGRFDNPFVTMVNPCAVKGISIFLELARRMPELRFAAVPLWGTTAEDRRALAQLPNVTILEPVDNIDELLRRTRVLLMPSLWAEARGRMPVEAMLRGVPVATSNVGGLPEAMMGVDYLLPVRPIEHYQRRVDDQMVPVAEVPEQDIEPWRRALREITTGPGRYQQLSRQARQVALDYAAHLGVGPFADYLARIVAAEPNPLRTRWQPEEPATRLDSKAAGLTPEKRALLALRLKKKAPVPPAEAGHWFPGIDRAARARLRLFCFPYAGGGAAVFRHWQSRMPEGVAIVPARLPGRESRSPETPIDRIETMRDAVVEAIRPYLDEPFALFGHSMGAMIAFELARRLRREQLPLPVALLVASARAPQLRRHHVPAPSPTDEEFLAELHHIEGLPREVLENRELLEYLLPALKADSTLGRLYVYAEQPPLAIPIRAYRGSRDERLPGEVVEAWREQTTASFAIRSFPGGHFFLHTAEEEFLEALARDLGEFVPSALS